MYKKICFISLGSYPLLTSNENLEYVGGAEVKQVLVAKELAKKGYKVTIITYGESGKKKEEFSDLIIIKTFLPSNNFSYLKKARLLWRSLKEADSEIYIQSGGTPGLIAVYCSIYKKKYIKWLSSDKNVLLEGIGSGTSLFTKIALYLDIKLASLIIVQNEFQKNMVEKKFKKKNVLIKNPIITPQKNTDFKTTGDQGIILWVGTIRTIKQPELFLRIAKALSDYKFKMIGGKSDSEPYLYNKIQDEVTRIKNLEFVGFIPHNKIQKYYKEASILVNTSTMEGFPNTFLEAWINYTPVVSLNVDPDEVICNKKLGLHSKTFKQMTQDVESLIHNDKLRHEMGMNARKYVKENHDIKKITNQFVDILTSFEM